MNILKPIISAIIAGAIALFIETHTGFSLLSFNIFYILPLGAFIIGLFSAIGMGSAIHKSNTKITKLVKGFIVVWMLILFICFQYAEYTKTYVSDEGKINLLGEGNHISEYSAMDSDEPFNFISYTIFSVNNESLAFYKYGKERLSTEGAPIVNWIFYLITIIGFIGGGLSASAAFVSDLKYCDKCKQYMKDNKIGKLEAEADKDRFYDLIKDGMNYKLALQEIGIVETPQTEVYYEFSHHKCDKCQSEIITSAQYQKNEKGKYDVNSEAAQECALETV